MEFTEFLENIGLDAVWALAACVVLALIGKNIQRQPKAKPHGFMEGDLVYVVDEDADGEIVDIEPCGRIWVKFSDPWDFQWYPATSLKKVDRATRDVPTE